MDIVIEVQCTARSKTMEGDVFHLTLWEAVRMHVCVGEVDVSEGGIPV